MRDLEEKCINIKSFSNVFFSLKGSCFGRFEVVFAWVMLQDRLAHRLFPWGQPISSRSDGTFIVMLIWLEITLKRNIRYGLRLR